jgi:folate-binding Fe-S cluster repair protein YgfZ
MYDVFFHPHPSEEGGYLIEHDPREHGAAPLLPLLKRYILRSKVRVKAVDEWDLWSVFGGVDDVEREDVTWRWAKSGSAEPIWHAPFVKEPFELGVMDRRAPRMGRRVLVRSGDLRASVVPSFLNGR